MNIEAGRRGKRGGKWLVSVLLPSLLAGVAVGVWVERAGLGRYPQTPAQGAVASAPLPPEAVSFPGAGAPELIAEILRTDPGGSSAGDRAPVWAFLRQLVGRTSENDLEWLLSADEALNWLRGAVHAAAEIEGRLVEITGDKRLPIALREQAMQHLGQWAEARPAGSAVLESFRRAVEEERSEGLAGGALLGLLRSRFASAEKQWLCAAALECIGAEGVSGALREAACHVVERYGLEQAEPELRKVLSSGGTVGERLAALRALGEVGGAETLGWLEGRPSSGAPLEAAARGKALERIRLRLAAAGGAPRRSQRDGPRLRPSTV
jgi:hypothetical protein